MSEIKVGSKVAGYDFIYRFVGTVTGVSEFCADSFIIQIDYEKSGRYKYCANKPESYHRKQCRLLVKVRKCEFCSGKGKVNRVFSITIPGEIPHKDSADCPKCNGKGKVRI